MSPLKFTSSLWRYYFIPWNKIYWKQAEAAKKQPMYHSVPQMTSSIRCGGRGYRAVLKVTCLEHPVPPPLETPQGQSPPQAAGPGKEQEATAPLRTPGAGEGGDGDDGTGRGRCPPGTCVRASQWQLEEERRGNPFPNSAREAGALAANKGGRCFELVALAEAVRWGWAGASAGWVRSARGALVSEGAGGRGGRPGPLLPFGPDPFSRSVLADSARAGAPPGSCLGGKGGGQPQK